MYMHVRTARVQLYSCTIYGNERLNIRLRWLTVITTRPHARSASHSSQNGVGGIGSRETVTAVGSGECWVCRYW